MFNFRPFAPGFNVQPADEDVPGFRMITNGRIREGSTPATGPYPNTNAYPFDPYYQLSLGAERFTPVGDGTPPPYLAYARGVGRLGGAPLPGVGSAQPSGMSSFTAPPSSPFPTSSSPYFGATTGSSPFGAPTPPLFPNMPASGDEPRSPLLSFRHAEVPSLQSVRYSPLSFVGSVPRRDMATVKAEVGNAPMPAAESPSGTTDPNIVRVGHSDDDQVEIAQARDQRADQRAPKAGRSYGFVPQITIERRMTPLQKKINRDQAFRELTRQPLTAEEARRALPDDWESTKPADIVSEIKRTAERHGVPIQLLARLLYQEGKFNEVDKLGKELRMRSENKDLPIGYAQMTQNTLLDLMDRAARRGDGRRSEELSTHSLANREQSFDAAAEQLAYLYRRMGGSWPKAVAAYNVGQDLSRWFDGANIDPRYFAAKTDGKGNLIPSEKWTKEIPQYLRFVFRGEGEDPATADIYDYQPPNQYRARQKIYQPAIPSDTRRNP